MYVLLSPSQVVSVIFPQARPPLAFVSLVTVDFNWAVGTRCASGVLLRGETEHAGSNQLEEGEGKGGGKGGKDHEWRMVREAR